MIRFHALTLRRGTKTLLDTVDLTLHAGQRVGLVGANGVGKSSLFALLRGELLPDAGDLDLPPGMVIASVRQETPALTCSALDYVLDGDAELREIEAQLKATEGDGLAHAAALARFEAIDGYSAEARAGKLLYGLGFNADDLARPVAGFSGGWRMRLNLAQALMCRSDLLLLDEPTNHLDLEAVLWLEAWLASYRGTLLLISHDRDFLDATVEAIVHLAQGRLTLYTGNYAAFESQKAARLAQQQQAFEKQQREVAHLQRFIDRFRAKATKARQAQSRIKALERMERIAAAHVDSPFSFAFREAESSPAILLKLRGAAVGYGADTLLAGIDLQIEAGARIGLLGRNGAGKSTLIKLLAGHLATMAGERTEGKGLRIGYFAQHQLEQLRLDQSPLWHLQQLDPDAREQVLRDFLGGFDFRGDMATTPVAPFSGGEKARLALALIVWQRPNLLLLDEPTNHLDLEMRHALTVALQDYDGAMVVVSHDRHLLRATTDRFWRVGEGRVVAYDGDLDDYARERQGEGAPTSAGGATEVPPDRKQQRRLEAEVRQQRAARRKPLEQALARAEQRMTALSEQAAALEAELADPAIYATEARERLQAVLKTQGQVKAALQDAEAAWLDSQMALDALNEEG